MQTVVSKETESRPLVGTMRSAVLVGPQDFKLLQKPQPELEADEVLIKMQGCGICASSIPVWQGREWFEYPQKTGAPGHEGYGIILKIGSKVVGLKPGDRVAAISKNAYAEFDSAKAAEVVKIPEKYAGLPFPGESLACAMNIFDRSYIQPGQTVAIIGIGFLGSLLVQLAKARGAKVIALSRRKYSLEVALRQGADEIVELTDNEAAIQQVKSITLGKWCHRVIECTGAEWPLNLAIELTAIRGRLIVAGLHQGGMRSINMQLLSCRGIDLINTHERDCQQYVRGIENAIKAIENEELNPWPLITHSFDIDDITRAHEMLVARPAGFVKAILKFN